MRVEQQCNVFVLPSDGGYLVYAPLAGRVVYANADCVRQLQAYLETGDARCVDVDAIRSLGGLDWLHAPSASVPLPADRHFHPSNVTLFLTNRCNLRCSYCYAEAGEHKFAEMPESVYKAAIDLISRNARRAGVPLSIGFHGGGEPTVAWDTLVGAMSYARAVPGIDRAKGLHFGIATNGVMPAERADFVAREFQSVSLSFDGPEDIQNEQRPFVDGRGSFGALMSFVKVLRKHETHFSIRSTITAMNVQRMTEMVDFFVDRTGARILHFEPAFLTGRCRRLESGVPSPEVFADHFIQAWARASEKGAVLRFSAVRLPGACLSFCGCSEDAFAVTPEGDVTACFEVCRSDDPRAAVFHYGRYDAGPGRFVLDMRRLAELRMMNVYAQPRCQKCFAKWNCLGDCPAKAHQPYTSESGAAARCQMVRRITKAILERSVKRGRALAAKEDLSRVT